MNEYKVAAEAAIKQSFTQIEDSVLRRAMEYCVLPAGKMLRPVLLLEFCRLCGGDWKQALPFACAVEFVHAYSLAHDDLPCMDNDDFRRGRPSAHKKFGEALAVLAGDALQSLAFQVVFHANFPPKVQVRAGQILAKAAGACEMALGQALDVSKAQKIEADLIAINRLKTGALLQAAVQLGGVAAGTCEEKMAAGRDFAENFALCFQAADDLADGHVKSDFKAEEKEKFIENFAKKAFKSLEMFGENSKKMQEFAQEILHNQAKGG